MLLANLILMAAIASSPQPTARHVVIVGIDGLRAAAVREQPLPNISALIKRGASTLHARAVMPTDSSPNWASMISGAGPEQHGVTSNGWEPDKPEIAPVCKGPGGIFPTIFGVLRGQRRDAVIGCFHDWDGFGRLLERSASDAVVRGDGPVETMREAIAFLESRRPAFLFIQLDHVDHAGHDKGYVSPEYNTAVIEADRLIGELEQALRNAGMLDSTVLLVTSDHGGVGTKHGKATMAEIEIPWIIAGPGIAQGRTIDSPVNTYDTAATAARILGITPHPCWTGRPVVEAFSAR